VQTVELEREYRAACQKMLASLDLRGGLNRINEEGAQILANPSDDEAIQRYRRMVENVVAKLDERDQLRQKDGFKEALQELLQLGEQLGYARKAEPAASVAVERAEPVVAAVKTASLRNEAPVAPVPGFRAVEQELAELQQQLVQMQQSG
jgi:phosphoglycolate phosphatase-like HAD superfamily hydrolase